MNSQNDPGRGDRTRQPLSEAAKASLFKTQTLFRIFIIAVLGSFFVYQLDISYLWLSAVLNVAAIALGIVLLIRAAKLKESRLVLIGVISGLVIAAVQVLLLVSSALFYNQLRDYQECIGGALTQQAQSQCRMRFEESLPLQLR